MDPLSQNKEFTNLRYMSLPIDGIERKKIRGGFIYVDPRGREVKDRKTLDRINSLVIPPAWDKVWICPFPNGHIQATGIDQKGRKQYLYHPSWRGLSQQNKFGQLLVLGENLPKIRRKINEDINKKGLGPEKVLATIVWLLDNTFMRVGNERYTKENKSYGLTTLKDRHVSFFHDQIKFEFIGKKGIKRVVDISDKKISRIVSRCKEIPGYELFQYFDENGQKHPIDSGDVNNYLKNITKQSITAKNFRTWGGSYITASTLTKIGDTQTEKKIQKNLTIAVKTAARHLGNKPATAKKYYIHPAVLSAYEEHVLVPHFKKMESQCYRSPKELDCCEYAMLALFKKYPKF